MEQLINQYAWLVDITLKKYLPSKMHDEDYHQIGMIALWNALKQYKSYKGTKFETYAINVIRNRLYNEMKRESRKKRSCNNVISLQKKINDSDAEEIYVEDIIADKQDSKIIDIKGYVESLSDEEKDEWEKASESFYKNAEKKYGWTPNLIETVKSIIKE